MKAMIFAAGLGTRLKPLTDTLPKALVPVGGKPLIEHVIGKLRAAGIDEAVINVHHFADKIENWLAFQDWISLGTPATEGSFEVCISDEREMLLETGGGVFHARGFLEGCGHFLVHNVDILSDLDIASFEDSVPAGALATLAVSDRVSSRKLLFEPDTMRLVGWLNTQTGEVRSPYPELDPTNCLAFAFSGIHILSDRVFDVMETYVSTHDMALKYPRFPIMDFYLSVCDTYNIYGTLIPELHLVDVGKSETLKQAEDFLKKETS